MRRRRSNRAKFSAARFGFSFRSGLGTWLHPAQMQPLIPAQAQNPNFSPCAPQACECRTNIKKEFRWTRLQPIRTVSRVELEFVVFTQEAFQYQRIGPEADTMRRLGMSFRAIGAALGVDEKQVRKALRARGARS